MNLKSYILSFVAGSLLLMACSTPLKVMMDYDKTADFKKYKTFKMATVEEKSQTISKLNIERIITAIKAEMKAKGFQESTSDPDLIVDAITVMKEKKAVSATTDYYDYGGMYRPYGWGTGMSSGYTTYHVDTYIDGSLIIDIADAKTQKLVWEGVGNKEIDGPLKNPDEVIPAAVKKIMAGFPPGAATK